MARDMGRALCCIRINVSMKVIGSVITSRDLASSSFLMAVFTMDSTSMVNLKV